MVGMDPDDMEGVDINYRDAVDGPLRTVDPRGGRASNSGYALQRALADRHRAELAWRKALAAQDRARLASRAARDAHERAQRLNQWMAGYRESPRQTS
jgi:hypothetical protein